MASTSAHASWQELHETADDIRVVVDPDGNATFEHHLRYRVVAGHFKTIDLTGVDPRAQVFPEVTLTPERGGGEMIARLEPVAKTPGTLRIVIDEGKGLGRGTYLGVVRYRLDLVSTKMLVRDGALWKLAWTAPAAPEGHDGARVVFDVPSAPTEPRIAGATESSTTLATLHRGTGRDELELVRAHVPRGEAVVWAARLDPRALPQVTAPELRPAPVPEAAAPSLIGSNIARVGVAAAFALLAGGLALLLRAKQRAVRQAAEQRGVEAKPLLPIPGSPFVFGVVTALALALLLWKSPLVGALLVAFAMAVAAHRAPQPLARSLPGGVWTRASDPATLLAPASDRLPTDIFDIATWHGKAYLLGSAALVGVLAFVLRSYVPQITLALPLAAVAIVPIFLTGTRAQLPKTPVEIASRVLRPVRDALASAIDLSHLDVQSLARRPEGDGPIDEVRLACVPREPTPGLHAIELAVAGEGLPEIIVRYDGGSPAADRVGQVAAAGGTLGPGRSPAERTLRFVPEHPTPAATAALLAQLAIGLEERRRGTAPSVRRTGSDGVLPRDPSSRSVRRERRRPYSFFVVERPT